MATKAKAAKREAGKKSAKRKNGNDTITAAIGTIWLTMQKLNGKTMIEFSTDCVDPELNMLVDFACDNHGVVLEPERMITDCCGHDYEEIDPAVFDAIRKWIANNTNWKFTRRVDDSDLIED